MTLAEQGTTYHASERMPGGGTSNVYRVEIGGVDYAIKASPFDLQKEVDRYAAIGEHPNILGIVQSGTITIDATGIEGDNNNGTFHAIVFPFVESNLAKRIQENSLSLEQKNLIATQVLDALNHIHSKGFTKNDIKSDDVLVGSDDTTPHAYLADFNTSKQFTLPEETEAFRQSQQIDLRYTLDILIRLFSQPDENSTREALKQLRNSENITSADIRKILEETSKVN